MQQFELKAIGTRNYNGLTFGKTYITLEGIDGEKKARRILTELGWQIQQIDWIGEKDGQWTVFEIKTRE